MGKRKHYIAVVVLIVLTTFALRFLILGAIYRLPMAASSEAGPIDTMFDAHFWLISFLFALIMVFMLYSAVVFRRKPGDEEMGSYVHGHTGLEIAWTFIPTVVVIGFGVWGAVTLNALTSPDPEEMTIRVWGQQWAWLFEYPEQEGISTPELVLPANQPIVLQMESYDVLHSFWIPEFRVKQDVLPGENLVKELRFTPTIIGDYTVRCAELCGGAHAYMNSPVKVIGSNDFQDWIDEETGNIPQDPVSKGQKLATTLGCIGCHSVDGSAGVGPTWLDLFGSERKLTDGTNLIVDEQYLRESIIPPNDQIVDGFSGNIMPQNYQDQLKVEEIDYIIAFIESLNSTQ